MQQGQKVGQWVIDRKLSKGGQGEVWRVHSAWLDRPGALKVVNPAQVGAEGDATRLKLEMRTLCDLHHPNIVGYLDSGYDESRKLAYLVMQFIDGNSLKHIVKQGPSPAADVQRWFVGFAKALVFAHENGVFHRDIKPDNLMVRNDGTPLVIDFGINYSASREAVTTGIVPMTLEYLPPEMFREWSAEPHMRDIYALGLCLYEALTGKLSHEPGPPSETLERALARIAGQRIRGKALDPGSTFPEVLRRAVREATQPEVEKRLQSVAEFLSILEGERRTGIGWIAASAGAVAAAGITAAVALPVGAVIGWALGSGGGEPVPLSVEIERTPDGRISCEGGDDLQRVLLADGVPIGGGSARVAALPPEAAQVECLGVGDGSYGRSEPADVANRPPSIGAVELGTPVAGQPLRCEVSGASDPDGDDVTVTYAWTVNGQPFDAGDQLPAQAVSPRARIRCEATPWDWRGAGFALSAERSVAAESVARSEVPSPVAAPPPVSTALSRVEIRFDPSPDVADAWPIELRPSAGGDRIQMGTRRQMSVPPGNYAVHVNWVAGSTVFNNAGLIMVPEAGTKIVTCRSTTKTCR